MKQLFSHQYLVPPSERDAAGATRYLGTFGPPTLHLDAAGRRAAARRIAHPLKDQTLATENPEIAEALEMGRK
jgi:hypothetical protein